MSHPVRHGLGDGRPVRSFVRACDTESIFDGLLFQVLATVIIRLLLPQPTGSTAYRTTQRGDLARGAVCIRHRTLTTHASHPRPTAHGGSPRVTACRSRRRSRCMHRRSCLACDRHPTTSGSGPCTIMHILCPALTAQRNWTATSPRTAEPRRSSARETAHGRSPSASASASGTHTLGMVCERVFLGRGRGRASGHRCGPDGTIRRWGDMYHTCITVPVATIDSFRIICGGAGRAVRVCGFQDLLADSEPLVQCPSLCCSGRHVPLLLREVLEFLLSESVASGREHALSRL
ncbi:hypothetical protein BD413DRAFT_570790 [Trametes elegans]|nr:hypothetical protein BD413DRAFT_570790 [Trametes elegans]